MVNEDPSGPPGMFVALRLLLQVIHHIVWKEPRVLKKINASLFHNRPFCPL